MNIEINILVLLYVVFSVFLAGDMTGWSKQRKDKNWEVVCIGLIGFFFWPCICCIKFVMWLEK